MCEFFYCGSFGDTGDRVDRNEEDEVDGLRFENHELFRRGGRVFERGARWVVPGPPPERAETRAVSLVRRLFTRGRCVKHF